MPEPEQPKQFETEDRGGGAPLYYGARISLFFGALFLIYGVFVPYLPVWLDSRGLSPTEISVVVAGPFLVRLVFTPAVAGFADRLGNYRLVVVMLAWSGLAFVLLLSQMHGFWLIFIVAIVCLISTTTMMPLTETIAVTGVRTAGLDYGRMRLWGSVTFIAGNLLGGLFIYSYGAPIAIWLIAMASGLGVLCAHLLPGPPPRLATTASEPFDWRKLMPVEFLRSRVFVIFLVAIGCLHGAHATFYTFGALHWEAQGLSAAWVGTLWAIGVTAEVILFAYSAALSQRFGPLGLIILGACASVFRWTIMAFDPPLAILIPLQVLHAFTFGASHVGAILFITRAVPQSSMGRAQALVAVIAAGLGVALVGLASGPIYSAYGGYAFLLPALLGVVGAIAAIGVLKTWDGERILSDDAFSPKAPAPAD